MRFNKQLLPCALIVLCNNFAIAQNVGIANSSPNNLLEIGVAPNIVGSPFAIGNGTQAMAIYQGTNVTTWFSTTAFSLMGINTNLGYVGIGTQSPNNKLEIGSIGSSGYIGNDLAFGNGNQYSAIAQTAVNARWASNTSIALLPSNGYVGIGVQSPTNKLQIGTVSSGYIDNDIAFGNGAQYSAIVQAASNARWASNTSISLMPANGYVGIGVQGPTNKLQIGTVSPGYIGNDIAFGNGTQYSAVAQTAGTAYWYSNTNIALMPGNGVGKVGINTTTPSYPLEVDNYTNVVSTYMGTFGIDDFNSCLCDEKVSIFASNNIMALQFDAISDARIKDIADISNTALDLETLNNIQITNYSMKDKAMNGNKIFKKVIAQQVEEVYPQVVNKNVNFIPNVYQITKKIENTANGCLLIFKTPHHLDKDAKKLQLTDKTGMQQRYDIVAIPSDKEVLINSPGSITDTVFVYGEQVNDFRTVDYDGLTTLNISATQELSKQLKQQRADIDAQAQQIKQQNEQIAELIKTIKASKNK